MISNSTGMDIFDRGFEPMCYCVNTDGRASFKETMMDAWNNIGNVNAVSAQDIRKVIFSCWHIKRRDLLTLRVQFQIRKMIFKISQEHLKF